MNETPIFENDVDLSDEALDRETDARRCVNTFRRSVATYGN